MSDLSTGALTMAESVDIVDPAFADALRDWCADERESVLRYRDAVLQHSPFRDDASTP